MNDSQTVSIERHSLQPLRCHATKNISDHLGFQIIGSHESTTRRAQACLFPQMKLESMSSHLLHSRSLEPSLIPDVV